MKRVFVGMLAAVMCFWALSVMALPEGAVAILEGHLDGVLSVAFNPDGNLLASGSADRTIKLWDVKSHELVATLQGHSGSVYSVAFSPDGNVLASGSEDKTIKIWDTKSFQEITTLIGHSDLVTSVAFSPNGKLLASGSWDITIRLWDTKTYEEMVVFQLYPPWGWDCDYVRSVAFSPDGRLLACGTGFVEGPHYFTPPGFTSPIPDRDGVIKLWNVETHEEVANLHERCSLTVGSIAFSPDSSLVASGGLNQVISGNRRTTNFCDDTINLWDVKSHEIVATLKNPTNVYSIAFSSGGDLLASGGDDKTIKLWDMESYEKITELEGHSNAVTEVALSPDGKLLASGSIDGTVLLWDMNPFISPKPPMVSDIPDQTIEEGKTFASIRLDDYVSDPDDQDSEITWSYSGNTKLSVSIDVNRVANITVSEYRWSGSETIIFTARDPSGLSASDSAKFTVTPLEFEPGDVNGDKSVRSNDAIMALRISAGIMEPTYYQKVAADMNKDGQVKANDAIMILRKSAGLAAPGDDFTAKPNEHLIITMNQAHGIAGETITVPVKTSNTNVLAGGDICITYDSSVIHTVDVSSLADILLVSNLSEPGIVRIAFACSDLLTGKTLAEIQFKVITDGASPLAFKSVELYSIDAQPLSLRSINSQFISWAMRPDHSALLQNFPNPFNPDTWIPYQLKEESDVAISIYDVAGRLVRRLDLGHKSVGMYITKDRAAHWDGRNEAGEIVSSGVYIVVFKAGDYENSQRVVLIR